MHANVRAVVRAGRDAAGPVARGHSIRNAPHFIGIEGQDFAPSWQSQVSDPISRGDVGAYLFPAAGPLRLRPNHAHVARAASSQRGASQRTAERDCLPAGMPHHTGLERDHSHTPQRSSTSRQVCYSHVCASPLLLTRLRLASATHTFAPRLGQGGQDAYYRSSRFDHGSMVGDLKLGQTTVFASNFWKCGSGLEQRPHDPEDPEAPWPYSPP